ncbi:MAG TPA: hypothetical protein VII36_00770, partial [Usitatibacter sp.]
MPKDYKDAPPARAESRLNQPLLLGVIIGLLLGVVISLAVALWLNRLSNPFVEKGKAVEPIPKISPAQPPAPPSAAKAAEDAAKSAKAAEDAKGGKAAPAKGPERPRFEFYQILPGDKVVTDKEAKAASKAPPPAP